MNINDFLSKLEQQLGSDGSPYWNWCTDNLWPNQGYFVNGYVTQYCAEYVSAMLLWNGIDCIYFPDPCAFDYREIPEYERHYGQSIQVGDVISFDWDGDVKGDHVGFVTEVHDWGCRTNEGNTGSDLRVHECDRYWSNILFGIRPNYSGGSYVPPNNTNGGKLDVDGYGGYNTVLDMQHYLGTYEDGVISGQDYCNREYMWAMTAVSFDGYGSRMVTEMQRRIGAYVDGQWGPNTSECLQRGLIERGYSCGDCGVDGYFGRDSVMALQRALNDKAIFV